MTCRGQWLGGETRQHPALIPSRQGLTGFCYGEELTHIPNDILYDIHKSAIKYYSQAVTASRELSRRVARVTVLPRMKIRASVVSLSFIFPLPPEDEKKRCLDRGLSIHPYTTNSTASITDHREDGNKVFCILHTHSTTHSRASNAVRAEPT